MEISVKGTTSVLQGIKGLIVNCKSEALQEEDAKIYQYLFY